MDIQIKSQLIEKERKKDLRKPFDAKFCVAVVGSFDSGKEDILGHECNGIVKKPERKISIISKMYQVQDKQVQVEYWCAPESEEWLGYTSRLISGLAATIFFFDVTNPSALQFLQVWMDQMSSKETSKGYIKALVGNKIDMPGRRVILQEDAEAFAYSHDMEYYETSPTDDADSIHEIFQSIVAQTVKKIPSFDRLKPKVGAEYGCPLGLQLNLALEPTWRYKYKQKVSESLPNDVATSTVDWLPSES